VTRWLDLDILYGTLTSRCPLCGCQPGYTGNLVVAVRGEIQSARREVWCTPCYETRKMEEAL